MEFKKNIRNLSKDIEDIGNFVKKIENSSHITELEMDILKAKIHKLYQTFLNFDVKDNALEDFAIDEEEAPIIESQKKASDSFISDEKVTSEQIPTEEDEILESPDFEEDQFEDNSDFVKAQDEHELESFGTEEMIEDEILDNPKEEIIENVVPPIIEPIQSKKKKDPEVVADIYKNKKKFRNENIQTNNTQDISSKFHSQPISDISLAIGLNDKFQYIRELFGGDNLQYAETLRYLNNVKSENEAVEYLNDKFEWDMETKLVKSLLELTARKLKMADNG